MKYNVNQSESEKVEILQRFAVTRDKYSLLMGMVGKTIGIRFKLSLMYRVGSPYNGFKGVRVKIISMELRGVAIHKYLCVACEPVSGVFYDRLDPDVTPVKVKWHIADFSWIVVNYFRELTGFEVNISADIHRQHMYELVSRLNQFGTKLTFKVDRGVQYRIKEFVSDGTLIAVRLTSRRQDYSLHMRTDISSFVAQILKTAGYDGYVEVYVNGDLLYRAANI